MRKLLLSMLFIAGMQYSFCQWNSNTLINNVVANTAEGESDPRCVTDGANGSIMVFNRGSDIYAQKVTSAGTIAWGDTTNPVLVCNAVGTKFLTNALADGLGGVFIVWADNRHDAVFSEIYIQHLNLNGVALWPLNGIRVTSTAANDDYEGYLCADGTGGIIVAWNADDLTSNNQVFAQRYNSAGVVQWIPNGVQVCTAPGFRAGNNIVTDGASGAIIFFIDTRDDPNGSNYTYVDTSALVNINIYAQRLNGSGAAMWTNNGVVVCSAPGNQDSYGYGYNSSVSDGSGGAIVVFNDGRNDTPDMDGNPINNDLYAQHVNSSGAVQWGANGLPVATQVGNQYLEAVISDGTGGAVAAWSDEADGIVYSQIIDNSGSIQWTINGIKLSDAGSVAYGARMIADGAGNYIYCFLSFATSETRLLAQKVNSAGALQWGINSAIISNNPQGPSSQSNPMIVLSDNGGAIVGWADDRNVGTTGTDIYASKLLSTGTLAGNLANGFTSVSNGNWNDPATWGGVVPPATAQVIIKHTVTITANATCYSLIVQPPAGNVIVQSGVSFTITH